VRELLDYLQEQQYQIGLASSSTLQYILNGLRQAQLIDYFAVIVSGENLQRSKPEPDIYLQACEKIGTAPADAYAIEDSYNGIRAASRAGMQPIMVPDLLPVTAEMEQLSCIICKDLLGVREYLQKQCRC
jgi:HAD superfamily hydrolase (TIGR01509 family)